MRPEFAVLAAGLGLLGTTALAVAAVTPIPAENYHWNVGLGPSQRYDLGDCHPAGDPAAAAREWVNSRGESA